MSRRHYHLGRSSPQRRRSRRPLVTLDRRRAQRAILATAAGAVLLIWPALLNHYPILFSDTGGLLAMGLEPSMGWDKPWVYGPLLVPLHLRTTLWPAVVAQGLLTSYVLFLTQSIFSPPSLVRHATLCVLLAAFSAAPWIAATLMPDLFTPITVLALFTLGYAQLPRPHLLTATLIAAVAIAAHLSNLIVASACILAIALLRRSLPWRPAAPLLAALAFLCASNWIGHGKPGISPYGSVFALARLVGDGPARDYLNQVCPAAGFHLCAWTSKLTSDSDQFLWDPEGPFWADPTPLPEFAAEASTIVAGTIRSEPLPVLTDAARNTIRQLGRFQLGDTLGPDYLDTAVRPKLARWFPPAELSRYDASRQRGGKLLSAVQPFLQIHLASLGVAAAGCMAILIRGLLRPTPIADLTATILVALAANAFATGALSTVHDRYGSRIVWLILLPPAITLLNSLSLRERAGVRVRAASRP